jgi:hypothetical protein
MEIRLGSEISSSQRFVVRRAIAHPTEDIAVLILSSRVPKDLAVPSTIATAEQIRQAFKARVVGFGITETGNSGTKMMADVPFIRNECSDGSFGCRRSEMVLGGGRSDTCNGDSGGPAFIEVDGTYLLAGVTSRAIGNSGTIPINGKRYHCGFGGIYVNARALLASFIVPAIKNEGAIEPGEQQTMGEGTNQEEPEETEVTPEVSEALQNLKSAIKDLEAALN